MSDREQYHIVKYSQTNYTTQEISTYYTVERLTRVWWKLWLGCSWVTMKKQDEYSHRYRSFRFVSREEATLKIDTWLRKYDWSPVTRSIDAGA